MTTLEQAPPDNDENKEREGIATEKGVAVSPGKIRPPKRNSGTAQIWTNEAEETIILPDSQLSGRERVALEFTLDLDHGAAPAGDGEGGERAEIEPPFLAVSRQNDTEKEEEEEQRPRTSPTHRPQTSSGRASSSSMARPATSMSYAVDGRQGISGTTRWGKMASRMPGFKERRLQALEMQTQMLLEVRKEPTSSFYPCAQNPISIGCRGNDRKPERQSRSRRRRRSLRPHGFSFLRVRRQLSRQQRNLRRSSTLQSHFRRRRYLLRRSRRWRLLALGERGSWCQEGRRAPLAADQSLRSGK